MCSPVSAALVGVVIGVLAETWRDRLRQDSEGRRTTNEHVAAFLAAAITCDDLAWDIWFATHRPNDATRPAASDASKAQLGLAFRELMPQYLKALLVLPTDLQPIATDLYEHIKLYSRSLDDDSRDVDEWQIRSRDLVNGLISATRQHTAQTGGGRSYRATIA